MTSDRDWRRDPIDAGLTERPPASTDPQEWAAWCDRKATAAEAMRDEAFANGDGDAAAHAEHLRDLAVRSARRLRNGPGA